MSTDILTQLQTTYTQLLTQFYSTISYLSQRHPIVPPQAIANDPYTQPPVALLPPNTPGNSTNETITQLLPIEPGPEDADPARTPFPLRPDSPRSFDAAKKELAEDLVLKAQQIQYLIENLPGLGRNEAEQKIDIQRLVEEVDEMEKLRRAKRKEMRLLVARLEKVMSGMGRSIELEEPVNGISRPSLSSNAR